MGGQTLEEMARYESDYKNDESTGTSDVWRYRALSGDRASLPPTASNLPKQQSEIPRRYSGSWRIAIINDLSYD